MSQPQPKPTPLRRDLGLLDAVAVGWGAIVGAGIFVVIGLAADIAGPAFLISLVIAATVATFNALSSAELAARYPRSGGTYEYGYELLHPWAGFAAGWTFLASKLAAGGTVALGFGSYLSLLFPNVLPQAGAVGAVVFLTAMNLLGIRKAGRLNLLIVAVTLTSLVFLIVVGFPQVRAQPFQPFAPEGWNAVLPAAALLFFAYTGYARIATLAEEVRDPAHTIPRAILLSLGTTALLYVAVAVVAVGTVGTETLAGSRAPLALAAGEIGGSLGSTVITVGATTAMLGVLLSQILGISRVMLAMGRRGDLSPFVSHVSPRFGVPGRAVLLTGSILLALILWGTLEWIVSSATFSILLYYTITNLAALRLEGPAKRYPSWIAMAGVASCLVLATSLGPRNIGWGLLLLAVGLAGRSLARRSRSTPSE